MRHVLFLGRSCSWNITHNTTIRMNVVYFQVVQLQLVTIKRLVSLVLLLCVSTGVTATTKHICFLSEVTPPFYWVDASGKAKGANVDLANAIAPLLPFSSSIEHMPWARAYQETLTKPDMVLLTLLRTQKREDDFEWLGAVSNVEASLIRLKRREELQLNNLAQAKAFRVGTIRGYGSANYLLQQGFEENKNLVLVSEPNQLWKLLYRGRIDFVLSNLDTGSYEIEAAGFNPIDVTSTLVLEELSAELHVATGMKTGEQESSAIKQAIISLKESGEYQRILRKWGLQPAGSAPIVSSQ